MISLYDRASIEAALSLRLDPKLRSLLEDRLKHYEAAGLLDLTHLLIVQSADTDKDLMDEIGMSPLVNPLDGSRYGTSGFQPFWDMLQRHEGWFELIIAVGDSGFAYVLFIKDAESESELVGLCRTYAEDPTCA
jgi:hypothetical protein